MAKKQATRERMSHEHASVTSSIERESFTMLNNRLTQENPQPITAVELLKDINEVEALLPPDLMYEQLKDSKSLRPKRNKLINRRYF
jgi:hypothetical protein